MKSLESVVRYSYATFIDTLISVDAYRCGCKINIDGVNVLGSIVWGVIYQHLYDLLDK